MSDKRMGNNIYSLLAVEEPAEVEAKPKAPAKAVAAPKKESAKPAAKAPAKAEARKLPTGGAADFVEAPVRAPHQHHVNREEVAVRPGKKVFERHSAPGLGRPAAKGGHNSWGKPGDESREDAPAPAEETAVDAPAPAEGAAEGEKTDAPAETAPKAPEELDLATFLKKQEEARVKAALPPPRKIGEGEYDTPEWDNAEPLERDEEDYYTPKEKKSGKKKGAAKKDEDLHVPLSQFLADSSAGQQLASKLERDRRDRQRRERATREAQEAAAATAGPAAPAKPQGPPSPRARVPRGPPPRIAPPKMDESSFPSLAGGKKTPPQPTQTAAPTPAAHGPQ